MVWQRVDDFPARSYAVGLDGVGQDSVGHDGVGHDGVGHDDVGGDGAGGGWSLEWWRVEPQLPRVPLLGSLLIGDVLPTTVDLFNHLHRGDGRVLLLDFLGDVEGEHVVGVWVPFPLTIDPHNAPNSREWVSWFGSLILIQVSRVHDDVEEDAGFVPDLSLRLFLIS